MILLIDNYDSFVHNLARYFQRLGQETIVVRNDDISPARAAQHNPAAIVLSPGPCTPDEAGASLAIVRELAGKVPMLGVCLGHQTIGAAFGAKVIRAPQPMHGRASAVAHSGTGLFADLPTPLTVGRYHSLIVDEQSLPHELEVTARTPDGIVMALAHRHWPIYGVQFHPESILTEGGYTLLVNFLTLAGARSSGDTPQLDHERPLSAEPPVLPDRPVTF
jgi:anthranilate synthase/aminodeoxychorismate synthase-like glutamine amidotransferase